MFSFQADSLEILVNKVLHHVRTVNDRIIRNSLKERKGSQFFLLVAVGRYNAQLLSPPFKLRAVPTMISALSIQ